MPGFLDFLKVFGPQAQAQAQMPSAAPVADKPSMFGGLSRFNERHPGVLMGVGSVLADKDMTPAMTYAMGVKKERRALAEKTANENKTRTWLLSQGIPEAEIDAAIAAGQVGGYFKKKGGTDYSQVPVYMTDPETGETVLGVMGDDGTMKRVDTGGMKVGGGIEEVDTGNEILLYDQRSGQYLGSKPKTLGEAEEAKASGKARGEAAANLPVDMQTARQTLTQVDELLVHPGLNGIVGVTDQYKPSWLMSNEQRDAKARYEQLRGTAFLQAYNVLKGGGQITEVEGMKAEQAMARMDRAQDENAFRQALSDFRDAVNTGMDKLRQRAGQAAPAPAGGGRLRYNPDTGELE